MEILTNAPGLQLYTGNFLDGTLRGKNGRTYQKWGGVCLETQYWPDAPNQPAFPSTLLQPGQVFNVTTVHVFGSEPPAGGEYPTFPSTFSQLSSQYALLAEDPHHIVGTSPAKPAVSPSLTASPPPLPTSDIASFGLSSGAATDSPRSSNSNNGSARTSRSSSLARTDEKGEAKRTAAHNTSI